MQDQKCLHAVTLPTFEGACRGCPQSAVTLQARSQVDSWPCFVKLALCQESILKTLMHFVPEVRSVRSEEVRC